MAVFVKDVLYPGTYSVPDGQGGRRRVTFVREDFPGGVGPGGELSVPFLQRRLSEIAGVVPAIAAYPMGCRFNPRCALASDACRSEAPAPTPLPEDGLVRCHHA